MSRDGGLRAARGAFSRCDPEKRDPERRDLTMFSPAMINAKSHINDLQAEATANRLAKQAKDSGSRSGRIAGALSSVRSILTNTAEGPMPLPKLNDYPYRS
jgi:hypothetical protein